MNHKRQKQIETIALNTLHNAKAYRYPVNLERVATLLQIELLYYDFEDITSCIIANKERRTIGVSTEARYARRQRQIIAHALGHLALDHTRRHRDTNVIVDFVKNYYTIFHLVRQDDITVAHWEQEREANAFAAGLLMPHDLLLNAINTLSISFDTYDQKADLIRELAKLFDVTPELVGFRLATLKTLW